MELYLQFAHGMKELTIDLSKNWGGVTTILSPRDIEPVQLENWSDKLKKSKVHCLFDPQCYYPKTNHKKLCKYSYWDNFLNTRLESNEKIEKKLIREIDEYNDVAETVEYIIPSVLLSFDDSWIKRWERQSVKLIDAANEYITKPKLFTLALPSELLTQTEDKIEAILEIIEKWDIDGFYIIAQPPNEQYLVTNPLWLSNLLMLVAGLKLQHKRVVVGYANHQLLCLSTAKVDAIASGTFLNVRRFTNKFEDNDSIKRKSPWYYYPNALSEYKIEFLDTAFNAGVLGSMKPKGDFDTRYVDSLFSGVLPSTLYISETDLFKHYLTALKSQVMLCSKKSYKETISANEMLYVTAEKRISRLKLHGVYSQQRSFEDIIDVNRSAIQRLKNTRGMMLQFSWDDL